jgi:hypothetical protein
MFTKAVQRYGGISLAAVELPDFDDTGNLPAGVYHASLEEIIVRFCHGEVREQWGNVLREVIGLAQSTGRLETVYIIGSFVTAKRAPADIDLFFVMSHDFASEEVEGCARLLFDRGRVAIVWGICIYWITARTDRRPFLEAWQLCRDGGRRGIVEIQA